MQAFFLAADDGGQRFCIHHPPADPATPGKALLYIHPFAEEMNKSRRMAALQSRALAAAGHAVLQIDLRGCGDSSDDFGDASWEDWLHDVERGIDWLATHYPGRELWLWGLRAGCLLASSAAARCPDRVQGLLFWQPMLKGKLQLQQFLRLRLAAALDAGGGSSLMAGLNAALARGETLDIAGYRLGPALARGLEGAQLEAPQAQERLLWLEVSSQAELLPASQNWLERHGLRACAVRGPGFWNSVELEDAPELIAATSSALAGVQPACRLSDAAA